MKKRIAILGATGSIGSQALSVIDSLPDMFEVEILTAHSNAKLLIEQALKYKPNAVVLTDEKAYNNVKDALSNQSIKVFLGEQSLEEVVTWDSVDVVLAAIVGFAGLRSTIAAINAGKTIALANKETLVVAGKLVMELAAQKNVAIIPVDSEHSAIFQCLQGERYNTIEKVLLTASGGPFFGRKTNFLVNVKKEHALQHPNWTMGQKITIDSASLMNKGLEMIEAKWLFGLNNDQIEVVIHPQSIIHSLIQFNDGSIKAQLGLPDMKLPIHYALCYPQRVPTNFKRFDFRDYHSLNFEQPDNKTFRNLALATEAMNKGGNATCVLNAANEVVVDIFLRNRIGFLEMSDVIEQCLQEVDFIENPTLEDLYTTHIEAQKQAQEFAKKSQLYN